MDPAVLESLILREIRRESTISRRDLARTLDVARSTAGRRVDCLIERGLLCETGVEDKSEAGRPRRFLGLRGDFGSFVGFDFDARHVYGVLSDFTLQPLEKKRIRIPSPARSQEVIQILRSLITDFGNISPAKPILGYGVGVPGQISRAERIGISYPYIEGWSEVHLCDELEISPERLLIEHNTRAIAFGEYAGALPSRTENLLCLNIRTGISAAAISEGRLLRGHHEMAGEIRGWKSSPGSCGDSLEEVATVRRALAPPFDNWKQFVGLCRSEDGRALSLLGELISLHADTLSRLVQLIDPERIVIAGEFEELGSLYLEPLRAATAAALEGHYFSPPPIDFVFRGSFSGAIGAAALSAHDFVPREREPRHPGQKATGG